MSSVQGVVFAVAMAAVSGAAVIFLALKLQKSLPPPSPESQFQTESRPTHSSPRPCISSSDHKKEKKKKKKVRFAKDVVDPSGNNEEFRRRPKTASSAAATNPAVTVTAARGGMPANRAALYDGILRDRVNYRLGYSY